MIKLITDRTESDVLLGTSKGQYSAEDLNRVEEAVSELQRLVGMIGLSMNLKTKTDWALPGGFSVAEWPTKSQINRYLENVRSICAELMTIGKDFPATMVGLDWRGANAIERALEQANERIQGVFNAYKYSGEFFAGEE